MIRKCATQTWLTIKFLIAQNAAVVKLFMSQGSMGFLALNVQANSPDI